MNLACFGSVLVVGVFQLQSGSASRPSQRQYGSRFVWLPCAPDRTHAAVRPGRIAGPGPSPWKCLACSLPLAPLHQDRGFARVIIHGGPPGLVAYPARPTGDTKAIVQAKHPVLITSNKSLRCGSFYFLENQGWAMAAGISQSSQEFIVFRCSLLDDDSCSVPSDADRDLLFLTMLNRVEKSRWVG
jgi:hypothetical protein